MPVIIPAALAVGSIVIKAVVAASGFVASAVTATVGALPVKASAIISKGVAAIVNVTPDGVKNFITGIGEKVIHTAEKLHTLSELYKSKKDIPEENREYKSDIKGNNANGETQYINKIIDTMNSISEQFQENQNSGNPNLITKGSRPQQEIAASKQSSLQNKAEASKPTAVIDSDVSNDAPEKSQKNKNDPGRPIKLG